MVKGGWGGGEGRVVGNGAFERMKENSAEISFKKDRPGCTTVPGTTDGPQIIFMSVYFPLSTDIKTYCH